MVIHPFNAAQLLNFSANIVHLIMYVLYQDNDDDDYYYYFYHYDVK